MANIKHCPKFLEYALHALICSKKHIFANEQKQHVGKLSSSIIIIVPPVELTFVYFYSCHSN